MAELADALALGASEEIRGGSNPLPPTSEYRSGWINVFVYIN